MQQSNKMGEMRNAGGITSPKRSRYALPIIANITLGLLSRRFASVPLFIGDILWASLVYFLFRFVFINTDIRRIVIYSLVFSFAIEFSQLYNASWIADLRKTIFGKLVLGATFIWSDLLCYCIGIAIATGIDLFFRKKGK
jgi:hypothetical protein